MDEGEGEVEVEMLKNFDEERDNWENKFSWVEKVGCFWVSVINGEKGVRWYVVIGLGWVLREY